MKRTFTLLFVLFAINAFSQQSGSFNVGGDFDKFYPVTFIDGGWDTNIATELELGRSDVHLNSQWRGAMIAKVRFHANRWGNGASFIDANIFQNSQLVGRAGDFIAGWWDATKNNGNYEIIIWLRGGGTTYYYKSNATTNPKIYDGIQNALPFVEQNGPSQTYKTAKDSYVTSAGASYQGTASFNGDGTNFFLGNVGIGTTDSKGYRLAVNGSAVATSVTVKLNAAWPDYVFEKDYNLVSLSELEKYLVKNKHLPDMPSASEVETAGQNLGQMNSRLLKSTEELTLHLIEKDKQLRRQQKMIDTQEQRIGKLENALKELLGKIN